MRETNLLQLALGLTPPWRVTRSDFDPAARRLDIQLDFPPGSRFPCPSCGAANCPAYDTEQMTWRHLGFFQHQAYLHARVSRAARPLHRLRDQEGQRSLGTRWQPLHSAVRGAGHGHGYVHAGERCRRDDRGA